MMTALTLEHLLEYTGWERERWKQWFAANGDAPLLLSVGPHADARFQTVGDLIRHIFTAETRYVERLLRQPLTEQSSIPSDTAGTLFDFAEQSRAKLRAYAMDAPEWDLPVTLRILTFEVTATPRKFIVHALLHEIRHWAQIATLLRLAGHPCEAHDFIASPVMGGSSQRSRD